MLRSIILSALALTSMVGTAAIAQPGSALYEETLARQEERRIIAEPIAGIQNHRWYDYRTNVNEAAKELAGDLRNASDTEDLRDAWEEYRLELAHERRHYVEEMAERGFRQGQVLVGG